MLFYPDLGLGAEQDWSRFGRQTVGTHLAGSVVRFGIAVRPASCFHSPGQRYCSSSWLVRRSSSGVTRQIGHNGLVPAIGEIAGTGELACCRSCRLLGWLRTVAPVSPLASFPLSALGCSHLLALPFLCSDGAGVATLLRPRCCYTGIWERAARVVSCFRRVGRTAGQAAGQAGEGGSDHGRSCASGDGRLATETCCRSSRTGLSWRRHDPAGTDVTGGQETQDGTQEAFRGGRRRELSQLAGQPALTFGPSPVNGRGEPFPAAITWPSPDGRRDILHKRMGGDSNFRRKRGKYGPSRSKRRRSGALDAQKAQNDPALGEIVDAWPTLPEALKAGILAMIRAAGKGE